jgi:hypothetical protein
MTKLGVTASRSALTSFLMFGVLWAASPGDLSKYREFQLGTDLVTVATQAGMSPSEAKAIQLRPALIQELEWRPQALASSPQTEAVQEVVFSFYNGELFRIAVKYDRYETKGLTADDIIGAISAAYGTAGIPPARAKAPQDSYGEQEEALARWQDRQYCFDLVRYSYGPSFRLIGFLKRLEGPVKASLLEAERLDDQEAPQRDAARIASEEEAARTELEKARLANKPKFRP